MVCRRGSDEKKPGPWIVYRLCHQDPAMPVMDEMMEILVELDVTVTVTTQAPIDVSGNHDRSSDSTKCTTKHI